MSRTSSPKGALNLLMSEPHMEDLIPGSGWDPVLHSRKLHVGTANAGKQVWLCNLFL